MQVGIFLNPNHSKTLTILKHLFIYNTPLSFGKLSLNKTKMWHGTRLKMAIHEKKKVSLNQ